MLAATSVMLRSVSEAEEPSKHTMAPAAAAPKVGVYSCHMLATGGSIMTPYGAAPTVTPMPSGINRLSLDDSAHYRHNSGEGRYRYDSRTSHVIFETGPLEGFTVRSEMSEEQQWLRFAPKKGASLSAASRLGDHICVLQRPDSRSTESKP